MKIVLLLIFISFHSYAGKFLLQAAVNGGGGRVDSLGDKNFGFGGGFNTHTGYAFKEVDILASSYVYYSEFHYLEVQDNNERFKGEINYQSVSFGPMVRVKFPDEILFKSWYPSIHAGYHWALITLRPEVDDSFPENEKLTYNAKGVVAGIGLNSLDEDLPMFFEITYKTLKAFSKARVRKLNEFEVQTIRKSGLEHSLIEQTITISVGLTFI